MSEDWASILRAEILARGRGYPAELSRETGLPMMTLHDFIKGSEPKAGTLEKVARALGFEMRKKRSKK